MSSKACPVLHKLDRYADVRAALENQTLSVEHASLVSKRSLGRTILDIDGPQHAAGKRILSRLFTPEHVAVYRDEIIRPIVRERWQAIEGQGPVDLVRAMAIAIPPAVIFGILDLPTDAAVEVYLRDMQPIAAFRENNRCGYGEAHDAHERLSAFVRSHAERGSGVRWRLFDDLRRSSAGEVSRDELVDALCHLLLAGTETTICGIASLLYFIGEFPASWQAVVDGQLAARAFVEEVVRYEPPAPRTFRFPRVDTTLGSGVALARDSIVEIWFGPANRTEDRVDLPDAWCPADGRGTGASFGFGRHACIGKSLALAEILEVAAVLQDARFAAAAIRERAPIQGQIFRRSPRIVATV
jgi:cytochrome P450